MMSYDIAKLRRFLQQRFNDGELKDLLLDYFRPVYDDLTEGMTKRQAVRLLLDYCYRRGRMPDLLAALQRERPYQFDPDDFVKNQSPPDLASPAPPRQPAPRDPRQIFLSHAHQDADLAHRLADDLEARGYTVWIAPDSIQPGEKWAEAINRGLEESGLFLLLLSPHAVASSWVQMETNVAIELNHEGEVRLFPLMAKACRVPALWRAYQRISLRGGYEQGVNRLLAALEVSAGDAEDDVAAVPEPIAPPPRQESSGDPNRWVHPKTGMEMVRVPAGEFLYGDDKETIYLDEFWIAKTPVTNADYARFVADTGHEPPKHWKGKRPPRDIVDHPVVYVSWRDAQAYADWAGEGAALPTEQQWEKAARGTDGRKYPWGDEWRDDHCNTKEAGIGGTSPVGQFSPRGDSPYGCVDMAGNVWEWTASEWEGSSWRVLRGGSWILNGYNARAAYRGHDVPDGRAGSVGFRLGVVRRPPSHLGH